MSDEPTLELKAAPEAGDEAAYRVLARKYRPADFTQLIGQDAMVRILTNAIKSGRIAHAFMLTGVRGIGKTTTARIVARALNCTGPNGKGGPTSEPCGRCPNCVAIAEDRHVDVIEMDAASRTGVDNIRDLTDGVRYKPVSARYKIYIVDEVHMLSGNAFNALLKTLEEPPPHVKFVFATTEIRKVPVTVLSRCQRFDLRRVDHETLSKHFSAIAAKEKIKIDPAAIALIARAADGSVRDGLSLLDQAIALGGDGIDEPRVRDMLGLADRLVVFDLFEAVLRGKLDDALIRLGELYKSGADPGVVIEDLLTLTHWLTRVKLAPDAAERPDVPEAEAKRGKALASGLGMALLTRAWQLLLKGLREVQNAPQPIQAAEMVLVRLAYAADLPDPSELVRRIEAAGHAASQPANGGNAPPQRAPRAEASSIAAARPVSSARVAAQALPDQAPKAERAETEPAAELSPIPASFAALVALVEQKREAILHANLTNNVHMVRYEPGSLEFRPAPQAPKNLAGQLQSLLSEWTGRRWMVSVSNQEGEPTLRQQQQSNVQKLRDETAVHPLVKAVKDVFPDASIVTVRERAAPGPAGADDEGEGEPD